VQLKVLDGYILICGKAITGGLLKPPFCRSRRYIRRSRRFAVKILKNDKEIYRISCI